MRPLRLRGFGAWLGASAASLLAFAAVPVAAGAAPAAPELTFEHMALVPGGPAKLQSVHYWNNSKPFTLHDVKATIDTSKLAGVATAKLEFGGNQPECVAAGPVFTCTFDVLQAPDGFAGITTLSYRAADGAAVGAEGVVALQITSRELGTVTKTTMVTVAEGVALAVDSDTTILERTGKPGATVTVPLGVHNAGDKAITGVDLFFYIDPWYGMAKRYSNCEYGTSAAYCHFDTQLKAGASYALSEEMGVRLRPDIAAPEVVGQTYNWLTPADNRDNVDLVRAQDPKRGTDGELSLVAKPSAKLAGPQTDTTGGVDWQTTIINVEGVQTADLAAVGAEVSGSVGSTVQATVGVKNLGPAFVFGYPDPAAKVTVTAPEGTTVISAPADCEKSGADYICTTPETVRPFDVDKSVTWPFKLRIDAAGELTGTVSVKSSQPDSVASNDTAKLVVNPPGGAGDGSGGAGGGGSLPITGAPVMLVSAAGVLLLLGGAAAYAVSRRRRSRFVA